MVSFIFQKLGQKIGNDRAAFSEHFTAYVIWIFVFVYLSENNIDTYSSTLSRGIVLFLYNLPFTFSKDFKILSPESSYNLIKRQFLLIIYASIYAQMFFYLPVNMVYTINACGPLCVLILDYYLYQVKISRNQFIGVIMTIIGVLLIINGNLILHLILPDFQFESNFENYKPEAVNPLIQLLAGITFFFAQILWGYSVILVKKIDNATHYHHNFVYGTLMTMFGGCIYPKTIVAQEQRLQIFLKSLIFQGFPLAIGQVLFCHALFLSKKVGITTMAAFTTIILSYILKIFRYQETINLICVTGTILIVIGIYKIVIAK